MATAHNSEFVCIIVKAVDECHDGAYCQDGIVKFTKFFVVYKVFTAVLR